LLKQEHRQADQAALEFISPPAQKIPAQKISTQKKAGGFQKAL
jgi:hypothetical protein